MVAEFFHYGVSSLVSLGIIMALLTAGTVASLMHNRAIAATKDAGGGRDVRDVV